MIISLVAGFLMYISAVYFEFNKIDSAFMSGLIAQMCWQTYQMKFL